MKTFLVAVAGAALLTQPLTSVRAESTNQQQHIQANAKVFIEPMGGFENDLTAAFIKKHVPVVIVDTKDKADYDLSGSNETIKAGWAKTFFVSPSPSDHASVTIKTTSGQIVYAYAWDKLAARKGAQSAAEGIAKHVKQNIEGK